MLNANRMAANIRRLTYELKRHRLIADQSRWVLDEAASNIQSGPPDKWEVYISPERPLEFVQAESDQRLKPDIFCNIKATNRGRWPLSLLSLVLRVWSTKPEISFRSNWDAKEVKQKLDRIHSYKRVMFRCHYDSCSQNQYAPVFHLQFGGNPKNEEFCWFPHFLELPRFPSPPIDLILACEHVVATFFPSAYRELYQNRVWISLIRESESFFMREFYDMCKKHFARVSQDQTFLGHLCSLGRTFSTR